ncbi:hypothetical protein ACEPAI_1420 [Sanghuangporus weigelae]
MSLDLNCVVLHPKCALCVVTVYHNDYTVGRVRSGIYDRFGQIFKKSKIAKHELVPFTTPKKIRVDPCGDLAERVKAKFENVENWTRRDVTEETVQDILGEGKFGSFGVCHKTKQSPSEITPFVHLVLQNKYHQHFTFTIRRRHHSTKPAWTSVFQLNQYLESTTRPQFIKDLVESPRRTVDNDLHFPRFFEATFEKSIPSDDRVAIIQKLFSTVNDALPYTDERIEICHFIQAMCTTFSLDVIQFKLDKQMARILVFNNFRAYWERHVDGGECEFEKEFAFPLIVEEVDVNRNFEGNCQYQPRPDAAFCKHGFPRFIAEFDSSNDKQDLNRLYVQMACSLRLGLALRDETSSNESSFFLMGAFFTQQWTIHRLFAHTGENGNVYFNRQVFQMNTASEFSSFLFEFYNYARHVEDDIRLCDNKEIIAALGQSINVEYTQNLHTKSRPLLEASQDETHQGTKRSSDTGNCVVMMDALEKSNYAVHEQYFDDEYEPFVKLPEHVTGATAPSGASVIAKLLRKDSNELSFLRELSTRKSPHNHVIPLLATIQSSSGPLIILPRAKALSTNFMHLTFKNELRGEVWHMSRQLVEGIAFLHRLKIAHLNINPENLVYCFMSRRLYIIDFDLAMRCKDVEEMIEMSCGTSEWSAPEVVLDDDKPMRALNPIRADLWSCGRVLRFFAEATDEKEKDGDVMLLSDLLMDSEPRRRPLLHEVVDEEPYFWTSRRLIHALKSQVSSDKAQDTALEGSKLKRTRDDADQLSEEGSASEVDSKVQTSRF